MYFSFGISNDFLVVIIRIALNIKPFSKADFESHDLTVSIHVILSAISFPIQSFVTSCCAFKTALFKAVLKAYANFLCHQEAFEHIYYSDFHQCFY